MKPGYEAVEVKKTVEVPKIGTRWKFGGRVFTVIRVDLDHANPDTSWVRYSETPPLYTDHPANWLVTHNNSCVLLPDELPRIEVGKTYTSSGTKRTVRAVNKHGVMFTVPGYSGGCSLGDFRSWHPELQGPADAVEPHANDE